MGDNLYNMYSCNYPYRYYRGNNNLVTDERGALLPFLAGVLVTTPFVFLAKNSNNNPSYAYAGPMQYPYMGYNPYMMPQPYGAYISR